MKTEYDVKVPRNQFGNGKYATIFWDFYDSEHKTAKYTFDSVEEARKLYKSAHNIISRNILRNISATVRNTSVYFEKFDS